MTSAHTLMSISGRTGCALVRGQLIELTEGTHCKVAKPEPEWGPGTGYTHQGSQDLLWFLHSNPV